MIIFKTTNKKDGKVFIGMSEHNNPHNLGTGKYIKQAIKKFGTNSFNKEVLETFDKSLSLSEVMDRHEYWIKRFKSDNPKYGYNESIKETIPQKRRLTRKIQVLITPDDEDALNSIIIQRSMEHGLKPMSVSKYVRQIIVKHIIEETTPEKLIVNKKSNNYE
jgi:hypothetical protein